MDLRDMQPDVDPQETREWLEALDSVLEREGPQRANFLLDKLVSMARSRGAYIPYNANTAYRNTIPLEQEERPAQVTLAEGQQAAPPRGQHKTRGVRNRLGNPQPFAPESPALSKCAELGMAYGEPGTGGHRRQ